MITDSVDSQLKIVAGRLRSARRVLAATHVNPDGDALGSLTFFGQLCRELKFDCVLYCAGPMPESLQFLPGFENVITDKSKIDFASFDTIVTLDCATAERSNIATEIFARSKEQKYIEIDHHPATPMGVDMELRIPTAASTTQILFSLARVLNIDIDPPMATSLMTGIITDTANFIHPSATNETITVAAEMLGHGANISRLNDQTYRTKNLSALKLWGKALSRLERNKEFNLVYTVITEEDIKECQADSEAVEGISGFLAGIEDAAAIMVLQEQDGQVRGSLRTTKDKIDVNRLARALGGGGHRRASGFRFPGQLVCRNARWQVEYK